MSKFEYWKSKRDGKWYFHLKARNGEIICSGQGYTTVAGVKKGIYAVSKQASTAQIERLEIPTWNYFDEVKAMLAH